MRQKHLQNTIRILRFFQGEMTQEKLAELTGVSHEVIVEIENGQRIPSLDLAFRIAHIFKVPINEVFSYDVSEDPFMKSD